MVVPENLSIIRHKHINIFQLINIELCNKILKLFKNENFQIQCDLLMKSVDGESPLVMRL